VALSALVLSHLVYAYMTGISALFLLLWACGRAMRCERLLRFAAAWAAARWSPPTLAAFPAVEAVPVGVALPRAWKYDSFGAAVVLRRLLTGTCRPLAAAGGHAVVLAGFVGGAARAHARGPALPRACSSSGSRCILRARYWGALADLLPMHDGLIMHRFVGGVHLAR